MKQFTSPHQKTGELGEKIAVEYLQQKGFEILEQNYTKKIGEIDIVAHKDHMIHFVEVKTIIKYGNNYHPFENLTSYKMKKISRTIQWYLAERRISHHTQWCIDAISVHINREDRSAKLEVLWNVTMG